MSLYIPQRLRYLQALLDYEVGNIMLYLPTHTHYPCVSRMRI